MFGRLKKKIIRFNKSVTTRRKVDRYLSTHKLTGLTLEIGGRRGGDYRRYYAQGFVLDIARGAPVDVRADAHMLPFRTESVDSILCAEVLEHMVRPERGIDEMRRVLRPGGRLLLTTRFLFPLHDRPGDFFRFTKYGLLRLLRRWDVDEVQETDTSLETLAIALNRLWAERQIGEVFRALILGLSLAILPAARLASLMIRTDAVSTGYIVSAGKRHG